MWIFHLIVVSYIITFFSRTHRLSTILFNQALDIIFSIYSLFFWNLYPLLPDLFFPPPKLLFPLALCSCPYTPLPTFYVRCVLTISLPSPLRVFHHHPAPSHRTPKARGREKKETISLRDLATVPGTRVPLNPEQGVATGAEEVARGGGDRRSWRHGDLASVAQEEPENSPFPCVVPPARFLGL